MSIRFRIVARLVPVLAVVLLTLSTARARPAAPVQAGTPLFAVTSAQHHPRNIVSSSWSIERPRGSRAASAAAAPERRTASVGTPGVPAMASGMVIGLDPDTHRPSMPTPDQRARLAALARRVGASTARPDPVHHADGRASRDVRSWMVDYAVVRRTPDGHLVRDCVAGTDDLHRLLAQPAPAAPGLEER